MLTKSLRSAFLLSTAGVLAFTLTSAVLNLLVPALLGREETSVTPSPAADLNGVTVTVIVTLLVVLGLLVAITIGAYWLYRFFGEAYFGPRGAARWALFGAFFAFLLKLPDWVTIPGGWLIRYLFLFASVFLAFFAARAILPIQRRR